VTVAHPFWLDIMPDKTIRPIVGGKSSSEGSNKLRRTLLQHQTMPFFKHAREIKTLDRRTGSERSAWTASRSGVSAGAEAHFR
jgi:hypothetical protein